jgi:hypothetical protein
MVFPTCVLETVQTSRARSLTRALWYGLSGGSFRSLTERITVGEGGGVDDLLAWLDCGGADVERLRRPTVAVLESDLERTGVSLIELLVDCGDVASPAFRVVDDVSHRGTAKPGFSSEWSASASPFDTGHDSPRFLCEF